MMRMTDFSKLSGNVRRELNKVDKSTRFKVEKFQILTLNKVMKGSFSVH